MKVQSSLSSLNLIPYHTPSSPFSSHWSFLLSQKVHLLLPLQGLCTRWPTAWDTNSYPSLRGSSPDASNSVKSSILPTIFISLPYHSCDLAFFLWFDHLPLQQHCAGTRSLTRSSFAHRYIPGSGTVSARGMHSGGFAVVFLQGHRYAVKLMHTKETLVHCRFQGQSLHNRETKAQLGGIFTAYSCQGCFFLNTVLFIRNLGKLATDDYLRRHCLFYFTCYNLFLFLGQV